MKRKPSFAAVRAEFAKDAARAVGRAFKTGEAVGFKSDETRFRAWPSGAITRLDDDGDSVETKVKSRPTLIVIALTPAMHYALTNRRDSGLFGATIEDVAERLLCEAIRAAKP